MAAAGISKNNNIPITKIYIYPIDRTQDALVRQHFAQFGEIMSIHYRKKGDFGSAFVQFDNAKSASRAIEKLQHQISAGIIIKARAVHSVIPSPDSPFNIVNKLNDYCLLEIFECLEMPDLCSVAEVCTRFQPLAKKVFSNRFADLDDHDIRDRNRNERIFRNFGNEIKSLDLVSSRPVQVVELMAAFCSGTDSALTKLKFFGCNIPRSFTERLKPIFKRLKSLAIVCAPDDAEIAPLVCACDDLIELKLVHADFRGISSKRFEKLQKVDFLYVKSLTDFDLNQFLQAHSKIKSLALSSRRILTPDCETFQNFGNLRDLEELNLGNDVLPETSANFDPFLKQLTELKKLKKLVIDWPQFPADKLLIALNGSSINDLKLIHVTLDFGQFVEALKGSPVLNKLSLLNAGKIGINYIKKMVRAAPSLETLILSDSYGIVINTGDFLSIAKSVKEREKKTKLAIRILGRNRRFNIPDRIVEENSQWVEFVNSVADYITIAESDADSDVIIVAD